MMLANQQAEIVSRVLSTCCDEIESAGPWSWNCAVRNGARLPLAAKFEQGFLHLTTLPTETETTASMLEGALLRNSSLAGGVKSALSGPSSHLRLQTDIAVLDEKQLTDRFRWALNGFHDGSIMLRSPASPVGGQPAENCDESNALRELLRESSWPSAERGPNNFTVELDRDSAARANVRMTKTAVVSSVELLRTNTIAEPGRRALALFLLRATGALRLVRAHARESSGEWSFGIEVCLPPAPASEPAREIDHALSALATAHRLVARETSVLLNDAAARCYLAACDTSTTIHQHPKEI